MSTTTPKKVEARRAAAQRKARKRLLFQVGIGAAAVAIVLFAIFARGGGGGAAGTKAGGSDRFAIGSPATGAVAPPIVLPATSGGTFDLAKTAGKTTLLYFQEGVGCQPCWTQIRDLEHDPAKLRSLGIDQMVSITSDPLDLLRQKVGDENLSTVVLSDNGLKVSKTYHANEYGMMGTSRDGHTFIVVGPDGRIRWRGDYGGSPNYTMYVKVDQLVADIRAGLAA